MKQYYLIRPEHLNHGGNLFGGNLLTWADEVAFLTATMTYPGSEFVTRALEATDFKSPAVNGNIVEITGEVLDKKTTSCRVHVSAQNRTTGQPMFSTVFVMVNVIDGHKTPIQEQSLSDGTA